MKIGKRIKIIFICILSIILLSIIFANIDYSRTKNGKEPILAIYVGKNKNTQAKKWYGLGYFVSQCPINWSNPDLGYEKIYKLRYLDNQNICVYVTGGTIEE